MENYKILKQSPPLFSAHTHTHEKLIVAAENRRRKLKNNTKEGGKRRVK